MCEEPPQGLIDLAVPNATKFLQTVVVVDDRARIEPERHRQDGIVTALTPPGSYDAVLTPSSESDPESSLELQSDLVSLQGQVSTTMDDPEILDAKTLIDEFAALGVACAVIRPTDDDENLNNAIKLSERSDIVILDWILHQDNGRKTKELIKDILVEQGDSDRMRLIAIYTGEPNLRLVAESAAEVLESHFGDQPRKPNEFVATLPPVRLTVFGKGYTRRLPQDEDYNQRIVPTQHLPEILVREFAIMTTGLLPSAAIAALSEVRAQTHKLLRMFSNSLDPAYLGHRALLENPSDAENHVVAMLVTELSAILDSNNVTNQVGIESIRTWINHMFVENPINFNCLPTTTNDNDDVATLMEKGIEDSEYRDFLEWKWGNITHAFLSDALANSSNREFAKMMHMKNRYGTRPPYLTLGAVLYSESDDRNSYWVCLQPKCDSVRITRPTAFPMVELKPAPNHKSEFEIVVSHRGQTTLLHVPRKPSNMRMFTFRQTDPLLKLVAAERCGSKWNFEAESLKKFEWVCELKDEHAQRIVNEFAATFARVGVNESEWVRRSGVKRK